MCVNTCKPTKKRLGNYLKEGNSMERKPNL